MRTICILFLLFLAFPGQALPPIQLPENLDRLNLGPYLGYLEDQRHRFNLDTVQQSYTAGEFIFPDQENLNFGYDNSAYWLLVNVKTPKFDHLGTFNSKLFYVEYNYAPIDYVDFYLLQDGALLELMKDGDQQTRPSNPRRYRTPTFQVELAGNSEYQLLLRISGNGSLQAPITIWSEDTFAATYASELIFWGAFYGILVVMFIYNGLIFLSVRDRSYLYYMAYIASFTVFQAGFAGHTRLWLSPYYEALVTREVLTPALVLLSAMVLFTNHFLQTRKHAPLLHRLVQGVSATGLVLSGLALLLDYKTNSYLTSAYLLTAAGTCFALALRGTWQNWPTAASYLTAWMPFLIAALVETARNFDLVPINFFTLNALQTGAILQIVLLSLALADKFRLVEREKDQALTAYAHSEKKLHLREKEISFNALHEPASLLPNKAVVAKVMYDKVLTQNSDYSFVLISPANFSQIVNTLGSDSAEALIQQAAQRLKELTSQSTLCLEMERYYGESVCVAGAETSKFIVLLRTHGNEDLVKEFCQEVHQALTSPFEINELEVDFCPSIGVAHYPSHGREFSRLMRRATIGLEDCIEHNRLYSVYASHLDHFSEHRLAMMVELRKSIDSGGLYLVYQPQVDLGSGQVIGCEALIRWQHASLGNVTPAEFIPLAEQSSLISQITLWVLNEAFCFLHRRHAEGNPITLSVNLSPNDLVQDNFCQQLESLYQDFVFDHQRLILEVTESSMAQDFDRTIRTLHTIREMGFQVAIDDFGTGYSSLSYLRNLPVDELKIDKSFVQDLEHRQDDVFIPTILSMAKGLELRVVAEGIESRQVSDTLRNLGCPLGQGFHFSKPMREQELMIELAGSFEQLSEFSQDTHYRASN